MPRASQFEHDLKAEDEFIVVASDGIWDVLGPAQALATAFKHLNKPSKAAKALMKEARAKWEDADGYIDDITVVVVKFDRSGK